MSLIRPISKLEVCIRAYFFSEICEYLDFRELFRLARVSKTAWNKLSKNTYILNFVNPEKWHEIKEFKDFGIVVHF